LVEYGLESRDQKRAGYRKNQGVPSFTWDIWISTQKKHKKNYFDFESKLCKFQDSNRSKKAICLYKLTCQPPQYDALLVPLPMASFLRTPQASQHLPWGLLSGLKTDNRTIFSFITTTHEQRVENGKNSPIGNLICRRIG